VDKLSEAVKKVRLSKEEKTLLFDLWRRDLPLHYLNGYVGFDNGTGPPPYYCTPCNGEPLAPVIVIKDLVYGLVKKGYLFPVNCDGIDDWLFQVALGLFPRKDETYILTTLGICTATRGMNKNAQKLLITASRKEERL